MNHTTTHQPGVPGASPQTGPEKLPGIRHIVAIGSGKGGVGKSTVSVNLALVLRQLGGRIGLVDADVLGPSIPGMLGIPTGRRPAATPDGNAIPAERYGVKTISMGMLTDDDTPAVLRGPMVGKYLRMFIGGVQWGDLDYLILDLPPGTGDTQLTLAQSLTLSGAVIVTTPQDVSLKIARRGGGERMSRQLGVPFLGAIPLDADVVTGGDAGRPIVVDKPKSVAAQAYAAIAAALAAQLHAASATVLKSFAWTWDSHEGKPSWLESAVRPSGSRTMAIGFRQRDPRTLSVLWEDGHHDDFDVRDLRLACHCALCIEEMSGRQLLDPKTVRPDVGPRVISSIGNYAIGIDWNDGHNSGIYSFDHLRSLGERTAGKIVEDV